MRLNQTHTWTMAQAPTGGATHALETLLDKPASHVRAARLLRLYGGTVGVVRAARAGHPALSPSERRRLVAAVDWGLSWLRCPMDKPMRSPSTVAYDAVHMAAPPVESLVAYVLDHGKRLLARVPIAGGVNRVVASPADVMRAVFRYDGCAVVLVHNHPSGDPSPSAADRTFTEQVQNAAQTCGVTLVDHLVVARRGWCSLLFSASSAS